MSAFAGILLLACMVWFWLDSARARELATAVCEAACRQRGLQFLDQTVSLARLGVRWTGRGIRFRRVFRFDYSEEGVGRQTGHLTLTGIELEEFSLGLPSVGNPVVRFPENRSKGNKPLL